MTSIIIDEGSNHNNTVKNDENNIIRQKMKPSISEETVNNADDGDDGGDIGNDGVHHRPKIHTHYIFLVHGWLGNPKEMSYFLQSINDYIIVNRQGNNNKKNNNNVHEKRIKIHCPDCNVGKTNDGIANGGQRLANEIQEFIKDDFLNLKEFETEAVREQNDVCCDQNDEEEKKHDDGCYGYDGDVNQNQNNNQYQQEENEYHVTLSLVGYSLGGLYSRFSVSCIPPTLQIKIEESKIFTIHLHFNTFMTAVTPHLGILSTKRRYKLIGRLFGQSGDDLFLVPSQRSRQNGDHKKKRSRMFPRRMKRDDTIRMSGEDEVQDYGLLYEMATDYERFLLPMSRFQHRIAYANAFMTDFQVPTSTAAFLSKRSMVPHYVLHKNDNNYDKSKHDGKVMSFIASTCITEQNESLLQSKPSPRRPPKFSFMNIKEEIRTKDLIMSSKLDALGWKKVFIDCRHMNPLKSIPSMCKSPSQRMWDDFIGERARNGTDSSSISLMTGSLNFVQEVSSHKESGTSRNNYVLCQAEVTSKDLNFYMTRNERIQVPTGHGLVIANSKNEPFKKFHSNGKPIADHIASKLMEKVLDY